MKVGMDMVAAMCDLYKISPDWLLLSRGSNIFRKNGELPPIWIDDDNLTSNLPEDFISENDIIDSLPDSSPGNQILMKLLKDKDDEIGNLREEIGRLKEHIVQLEREKNVISESFQNTPKILSQSQADL